MRQRARVEQWGASGALYYDQAAPGDYDGDGPAGLAVWHASPQIWYVRTSKADATLTLAQGTTGDVPVMQRSRF